MYRAFSSGGGLPMPSTASSSSSTFQQYPPKHATRGLTPAYQPIHQVPPFPPLLPDTNTSINARKHRRQKQTSEDQPPKPECMTVQQVIILSQLFPEEWALLHPIYGGQGVTALSLRSLPSPESLPISPPGEEFSQLDLDAFGETAACMIEGEKEVKSGVLPSIKDVLGEELQWINWNRSIPTTTLGSPTPFSPSSTHSANQDDFTLPPILHSSSAFSDHPGNGITTASSLPNSIIHQHGVQQLHSVSEISVHHCNKPPTMDQQLPPENNAHQLHHGRLPPPLRTLCIPPPSLDLGKINHQHYKQVPSRLSPLTSRTTMQKPRYHPYNLSPGLGHPFSAMPVSPGSCISGSTMSFRGEGGMNSPLASEGIDSGFSLLVFEKDRRQSSAEDGSGLRKKGSMTGQCSQAAVPAFRPSAPVIDVARKSRIHSPIRPPYTFTVLITYALVGSPQKKLSLSQLYEAISERFTYFRHPCSGNWKASVRHSLTSNKLFVKEKRGGDDPGQGAYWRLATLEDGVDATKMLLSRHGGRNNLPGRCVPTPIAGGGTLQRPRIQHLQTNHEQQTQQQTPQNQMQQQAAIERRQQDMRQQNQAAILRQEEEKKKQAAIPRQHTQDKPKPPVIPQQERKKHQAAAQKYRFAPPLFQHTFERK